MSSIPAGRELLVDGNRLKLGLFGFNTSNGLCLTSAPTSYEATWEHSLAIARRADAMGLELMVPVARWRGQGGEADAFGVSFETMTWAAAIAASTRHTTVVSTVHLPMLHPLFAAKQCVTIDHVARGRYGFNAVMGWSRPEMEMFGATQREHDERYRYGAEWIDIVKRLWTESHPFDHAGEYFQLGDLQSKPKPWQQPHPLIINAGNSPAGMDFATAHADINFLHVENLEKAGAYVEKARDHARVEHGRTLSFMGFAFVICRPTEAEARAVRDRMIEMADQQAVDKWMGEFQRESRSLSEEFAREKAERFIVGLGGHQLVGTPDQVSQGLADLSSIGLDGVVLGFLDYYEELPFFAAEVLPRLEAEGLRKRLSLEGAP